MMEFVTLKWHEQIRIGDTVLTLVEIRNGPHAPMVRLGFTADPSIPIDRPEIAERKRLERECNR